MDDVTTNRYLSIKGTAVSRGVAAGPVHVIERSPDRSFRRITSDKLDSELDRLRSAIAICIEEIDMIDRDSDSIDRDLEIKSLFDVQRLLLASPSFIKAIEDAIKIRSIDAASAVEHVRSRHRDQSRRISDERFAEKQLDVDSVAIRLLSHLSPPGSNETEKDLTGHVIVCDFLRPLDLIDGRHGTPAAVIARHGGWTSHSSIVARQMKIPMITGVDISVLDSDLHRFARVDGNAGSVEFDSKQFPTIDYAAVKDLRSSNDRSSMRSDDGVARTADGHLIKLWTNHDVSMASGDLTDRGSGIGLFRSEFLFANDGNIADSRYQQDLYIELSERYGGRPINIRTFDLDAHELPDRGLSVEQNPALGLRGIRSSLKFPEIFCEQIRAIARANRSGNLRIVLPMISTLTELIDAKDLASDVLDSEQGTPRPQIGIMIEVPSAVLNAERLAQNADFFCLGTNDLVQYMLAVDRDNDLVSNIYTSLDPSILRSIEMVVDAAANAQIPLIACGEIAGSAFYIPILLALGVRELSVPASEEQRIADLIERLDRSSIGPLLEKAKLAGSARDIEQIFVEYYRANFPDILPVN